MKNGAFLMKSTPLTLRPYQLLCTVCSLDEDGNDSVKQYEKGRREMIKKLNFSANK